MRKVAITSVGITEFTMRHNTMTHQELGICAIADALHSCELKAQQIDAVIICTPREITASHSIIPEMIKENLGIEKTRLFKMGGDTAGGLIAVVLAWQLIANGVFQNILVCGLEKFSPLLEQGTDPKSIIPRVFEGYTNSFFETDSQSGIIKFYGALAQRFLERFADEFSEQDLHRVAIKNRDHARRNPKAALPMELSVDDWSQMEPIVPPLYSLDCPPLADAGAALLLSSEKLAYDATDHPVWIIGAGSADNKIGLGDKFEQQESLIFFPATREALLQALEGCDMKIDDLRDELQVIELADQYGIAEIAAYYDLGLCKQGEQGKMLGEGITALSGKLPVNTSGGLTGMGYAGAATSLAQTAEIFCQLREECEKRQVYGAKRGLVHALDLSGCLAAVLILQRG